jgi:predicted transposase YbfD/YdcC
MGTQRTITEKIVEKEGDYVLAVKGNQGSLHDEIRDQFDFATRQLDFAKLDPAKWSSASTNEIGHDRNETRAILVCHELDWMDKGIKKAWSGLGSVIMVHRRTVLGAGKIRDEISYYMSSLTKTRASEMLGYIRGHWKIENSCHWVLDAIYREDHNQTRERNAACNLGTLRRMALNTHNRMAAKAKKYKSLPKRELRALKDEAYLEKLLSLV